MCRKFPRYVCEPLLSGSEKCCKIPAQFFAQFPFEKLKKNHQQASAGSQGEIVGKGIRTATFQFLESGGSLIVPDLFTELPFL